MQSILEAFANKNIYTEPRFYDPGPHYGRTMEGFNGKDDLISWREGMRENDGF